MQTKRESESRNCLLAKQHATVVSITNGELKRKSGRPVCEALHDRMAAR